MLELFHSLIFRPYVTIFLLAFLALSWLEQGTLRTLAWLVTGYLVALGAEWASVYHESHIPFGSYVYHLGAEGPLKDDLIVFGIPFFDSLSFSFLSYVSFSFAQYFMSPLWARGLDMQRITPRSVRNSASVLFLGSLLMMTLDLVIDPLSLLGGHWFLGDIYHYPGGGVHFGVPLANYAGWFVVAWMVILLNQRLDGWLGPRAEAKRGPQKLLHLPMKGAFAPLFWAGIMIFMLTITYVLGFGDDPEIDHPTVQLQAMCGTFMIAPILVLAVLQRFKRSNMARPEDIGAYLAEYPNPKLRAKVDAQ